MSYFPEIENGKIIEDKARDLDELGQTFKVLSATMRERVRDQIKKGLTLRQAFQKLGITIICTRK